MSIESVAIALHHSRARGTAKLVLLGIANHDGDGGAFPKVATLAKYANVHPRRVVDALNTLGELGEIIIYQKEGGTLRTPDALRPNRYEFVLTCPEDCDRTKAHRVTGERIGRSYAGQYDPERGKDPDRVERGHKAKRTRETRQQAVENTTVPAGDENVPSDGNSTTPSAENSTTPSDGNSTTKNQQIEPPVEPGFVSTSPGHGAAGENLPSLAASAPARNDATRRSPFGITEEQAAINARGAAMAREAMRRAATQRANTSKEALDDKG